VKVKEFEKEMLMKLSNFVNCG